MLLPLTACSCRQRLPCSPKKHWLVSPENTVHLWYSGIKHLFCTLDFRPQNIKVWCSDRFSAVTDTKSIASCRENVQPIRI